MTSILKVDTIQKPDGTAPSASELGIVSSPLTSSDMPAGSVLQVKQTVLTTAHSYSGVSGWTDIMTVSITPKRSTSKFLITSTIQWGGNGANAYDAGFGLFRDSTQIALPSSYGSRMPVLMPHGFRNITQYEQASASGQYLDSPNTSSTIVYKIQRRSNSGNGVHYINRTGSDANNFGDSRSISTLTVMEIAQ